MTGAAGEREVRELLAAAGLPADDADVAALVTTREGLRPLLEALHAVELPPGADEPATVFRPEG